MKTTQYTIMHDGSVLGQLMVANDKPVVPQIQNWMKREYGWTDELMGHSAFTTPVIAVHPEHETVVSICSIDTPGDPIIAVGTPYIQRKTDVKRM